MTAENETIGREENHAAIKAGTLLKQKREQLGLSQRQIADRLRLRASIIEDIENNQFDSDHSATFTKGYIRSYAKAVGMDVGEVLKAYESEQRPEPEEQEMKSFSGKTKREKHDSRIMILTWGIVAIILGISSVWWWQNQQTSIVELTEPAEQEQPIEQGFENTNQFDPTLMMDESEPQVAETFDTLADAETEIVQEQNDIAASDINTEAAATETAPVVSEESTKPEVADNLLNITFNGDCWTLVKDSSGKTLVSGVKKGERRWNCPVKCPTTWF